MSNTSVSLEGFVLHCAIDAQQKRYTTPTLMMIYLVTLLGNFLVILVIITSHHLQKPMFICIAILAVIDLINSTNLIPKIVAVLLESTVIPYGACLLQMILVLFMEGVESLLLALMACDRFVAVIFPLRYPTLVTNKTIRNAVIFFHGVMMVFVAPLIVYFMQFSFCRSNVVDYCFCDYITVTKLDCNEDPKYLILLPIASILLGAFPFAFIILSYVIIAYVALKMPSVDGKRKVFITICTHLLVVVMFNLPLLISYVLSGTGVKLSTEAYNTMVIIANIVPPMLNPIIYSFRNTEIKSSIYNLFIGKKTISEINHH